MTDGIMPRWILTNKENGYAREILTFQNKDLTLSFTKKTDFYLYKYFCIQEFEPIINHDNPDSINLLQRGEKWRQIGLSRTTDVDWEFPESFTLDDQYNILKKWDHTYEQGLASIGWFQIGRQITLYGPLTIAKSFQTRMTFP